MEYKDLRNKTPLDFCKDKQILAKVCLHKDSAFLEKRIAYLKNNPSELAVVYLVVAEEMNDKNFISSVWKEFEEEINQYFNE